jgi:immune inhibitor A
MRHRNRPIPGADDRYLHERCKVAPSPEAQARLRDKLRDMADRAGLPAGQVGLIPLDRGGYNDGMIRPGSDLPLGTPLRVARRAALERAPLRGQVRVLVVLVDFSDKAMTATPQHFQDLFFSTGKLPHGSVREYYKEVTGGKITITGEVVGPFRMPLPLTTYAGGQSGTDNPAPNARTMAREAAVQADAVVDYKPYDNDGNGFVDAFIVVHAGRGAEETLDPNDIWSHKWVFNNGALNADGTKVFGYLTVPEDSKIGVCAHELGHLLFGWPDLYDTDDSSSGLGNWCLMAGGSWNGDGDIPAHPSAWCKATQDWVTTVNRTTSGTLTIADVKTGKKVYRLWKDGITAQEYFLVEHRAQTKYDAKLPGEGLLVYHVDDSIEGNDNEHHPQVKLIEADGRKHLEDGANRGDAGDPFPGTSNNANLTATTTPNSLAYSGLETCVSLTSIIKSGASIKAKVSVSCPLHVAPPQIRPATGATNTRKTKKTRPAKKARPTKKAKPAKRARPARKARPAKKAKAASRRRASKKAARR